MGRARRSARSQYPQGSAESGVELEARKRAVSGKVRLLKAERQQLRWCAMDLERLVGDEHPARAIWAVLDTIDLSAFHARFEARELSAGRPPIDPQILITLWVYAISEGVGSAREIERLTTVHDAYRWICGGVHVNHHTLSDFQVDNGAALEELFSQVLGLLWCHGLVSLERVSQDGMKVRAAAGGNSYRRADPLRQRIEQARAYVAQVLAGGTAASAEQSRRQRAAAARAARERRERIEQAQRELAQLLEQRAQWTPAERKRSREPRVSPTDPDARQLRMADGGIRPAYNVQFATDTAHGVIVGVGVTTGNDGDQLDPMWADIRRRTGQMPTEYLVDGGYVSVPNIKAAAAAGTTLYAPVPSTRNGTDRYSVRRGDAPEVAEWRQRMKGAKEVYKLRAATSEWVNADTRKWRRFDCLGVRGLPKVLNVSLWMALTHNVLRWVAHSGAIT